jgi:cytoskeleton protein RodZ
MVAAVRTEPDTAGARLASARERLGLSLDQVADHLKLDRHTVVALEQGDHRAIGASVFVRGFLRRYATLVGESAAEIEALYAQRPDAEARPDLSKTGMHRIEPAAFRPNLGVLPALIAALALAILGAAWWAMYSKPRVSASAYSVVPTPSAPVAATGGTGLSIIDAGTSGQLAPAEVKSEALAGRRKLQLTFSGEVWAEIYDARGMRLFFGFGHADTAQELSGVAPFRLVLGNGEAVAVAIEGTPVSLPPGVPGQRARILLDANGAATAIP